VSAFVTCDRNRTLKTAAESTTANTNILKPPSSGAILGPNVQMLAGSKQKQLQPTAPNILDSLGLRQQPTALPHIAQATTPDGKPKLYGANALPQKVAFCYQKQNYPALEKLAVSPGALKPLSTAGKVSKPLSNVASTAANAAPLRIPRPKPKLPVARKPLTAAELNGPEMISTAQEQRWEAARKAWNEGLEARLSQPEAPVNPYQSPEAPPNPYMAMRPLAAYRKDFRPADTPRMLGLTGHPVSTNPLATYRHAPLVDTALSPTEARILGLSRGLRSDSPKLADMSWTARQIARSVDRDAPESYAHLLARRMLQFRDSGLGGKLKAIAGAGTDAAGHTLGKIHDYVDAPLRAAGDATLARYLAKVDELRKIPEYARDKARLYEAVRRQVFWPNLRRDARGLGRSALRTGVLASVPIGATLGGAIAVNSPVTERVMDSLSDGSWWPWLKDFVKADKARWFADAAIRAANGRK
jgi:hypothetical protein